MKLATAPTKRQTSLTVSSIGRRMGLEPANGAPVDKAQDEIQKVIEQEIAAFQSAVQRMPYSNKRKDEKEKRDESVRDLVRLFSRINDFTMFDGHGKSGPNWVISRADKIDEALADIKHRAASATTDLVVDGQTETVDDQLWDSGLEIAYDAAKGSVNDRLMREAIKTANALADAVSDRLRPIGMKSSRPITNAFKRDLELLAALTALKSELSKPQKVFLEHAKSRMECWKEGFALLCVLRQNNGAEQLELVFKDQGEVLFYVFGPKKANQNGVKLAKLEDVLRKIDPRDADQQIVFAM